MCGIAGFVNMGLASEDGDVLLRQMTEIIRHRGPDDDGRWLGDSAALGMRRLSIIDVAGGKQPIINEDGSVVAVYNGEIYNYRQLRQELEALGHQFATSSDTETIVHAYEEDGLDFVRRLRGMFAIALWDRHRRRLVLTRDRFGKKPIYYAIDHDRLIFGSEIKSLLLAPGVRRELDPIAISQYFTFGYIPAPRTAFAGIYKLPAAHTLCFEDGRVTLQRYWQLDFTPRCPDDEETAARRVRALLTEAVRIRLMSEVPLGAFLSGGVDSSTVVALMSEMATEPVKTFSIGFEEQDYSEVEYARLVARRYHTDHHEFIVRPNLLSVLPELAWAFDEPFADASMVPTYYVSKLAHEHVTVALSGDGGDELFGGYDSYVRGMRETRLSQCVGPLGKLGPLASALLPDGMRGKNRLRNLGLSLEQRFTEAASVVSTPLRQRLLQPEFVFQDLSDPRRVQLDRFAEVAGLDLFTQMQRVDVETYLPYDILVKVDKASMFTSLEARAPLLDHVLAEYVASLPHEIRNRGGQPKYLFKRVARDLLPRETLIRRKMGFGLPVEHWLRGDLRELANDLLRSQQARNRGVIDTHLVAQLLADHQRRLRNYSRPIWTWLCFELWCRIYLDQTDRPCLAIPRGTEQAPSPAGRARVSDLPLERLV
jgi:asparagine synthase (glutamine-hydrolysing)